MNNVKQLIEHFQLEKHDAREEPEKFRSVEEMETEAKQLAQYFNNQELILIINHI